MAGISLTYIKYSQLFYTNNLSIQLQIIVKVHGVFPSTCKQSASSRIFQFHQIYVGDSKEVVTPFMQVGTYPTRNFATFGPLELQPPFAGAYYRCYYISRLLTSTGQVSVPIHLFSNLQRPVFLVNSRFSFFSDNLKTKMDFKSLFLPKLQSQFAEFL